MKGKRSLEGKMEAKKRDRERKRRDQLSSDQLDHVRLRDKKYKQIYRKRMSETEKQNAREARNEKNRSESKRRSNLDDLKELKRIDEVVRKRKFRSLLSDKEKNIEKLKAKVGMAKGRKNGSLQTYKQRKKRDKNELFMWKRFIDKVDLDLFRERNKNLKNVHEKLKLLNKQIRDFENHRRLLADRHSRMKTWKGRSQTKKEQYCNKKRIEMRKHRKIIYVEVEDFIERKIAYDSDSYSDSDKEENIDFDYY